MVLSHSSGFPRCSYFVRSRLVAFETLDEGMMRCACEGKGVRSVREAREGLEEGGRKVNDSCKKLD